MRQVGIRKMVRTLEDVEIAVEVPLSDPDFAADLEGRHVWCQMRCLIDL